MEIKRFLNGKEILESELRTVILDTPELDAVISEVRERAAWVSEPDKDKPFGEMRADG